MWYGLTKTDRGWFVHVTFDHITEYRVSRYYETVNEASEASDVICMSRPNVN